MCGIVGLISKRANGFYYGDTEAFKNLLLLDTLRGEDSTGAFLVTPKGEAEIVKIGSHPYHLFCTEEFKNFEKKIHQDACIVIGHNRKATQGTINSTNAHPFVEDNIILVHNGTISGHKQMAATEVDSHAICHSFVEKGHEETLKNLTGAFALVWYDINKELLYAIRNDERPLTLIETDDIIYLASESWMPKTLLARKDAKKNDLKSITLEVGMLYTFDLKGKYTTTPMELKKPVTTAYTYPNNYQHYYPHNIPGFPDETFDDDDVLFPKTKVIPSTNLTLVNTKKEDNQEIFFNGFKKQELLGVVFDNFAINHSKISVRFFGHVDHPGKEKVDIIYDAFSEDEKTNPMNYLRIPMQGKVSAWQNPTNGGPVLSIADVKKDFTLKLWNNKEVSSIKWQHVCKNLKCDKCGSDIHYLDYKVTSLRENSKGMEPICKDCVESKLSGEMLDDFQKVKNNSVQNEKQRITITSPVIIGGDGPTSTASIH